MGYDMHFVERDTSKDTEYAEANQRFNQACAARNGFERDSAAAEAAQEQVEAAYADMDRFSVNNFRFNIWGMESMRVAMAQLGMLATEYSSPTWPEPEEFNLDQETIWKYDSDDLDSAPENVRAFYAKHNAVLAWSPPDEPGLPVHKFGSNDGWVVTPMNARSALVLFFRKKHADPELVERVRKTWGGGDSDASAYFDEWIDYLTRSLDHGGFEVW